MKYEARERHYNSYCNCGHGHTSALTSRQHVRTLLKSIGIPHLFLAAETGAATKVWAGADGAKKLRSQAQAVANAKAQRIAVQLQNAEAGRWSTQGS